MMLYNLEPYITEYRKLNNNYNKDYQVKLLMISILKIQESYHKKINKTDKSVFIPLDMKKVSKAQENLRLNEKFIKSEIL